MVRPRFHRPDEQTFGSEVVSFHLHKVPHSVPEILGCGDHVYSLVRELLVFVLGYPILEHGKYNLNLHYALLRILLYGLLWFIKEGGSPMGELELGISIMFPWGRALKK